MNKSPATVLLAAFACAVACVSCTSGQNEKSTEPTDSKEPEKKGERDVAEKATTAPTGIDAAKARVESVLSKKAPKAKVEVNLVPGPSGVTFVRARDPKAYPGTGVIAVVFDDKTNASYGTYGDNKLAKLFAARGWFAKPPSDGDIIRLVHQAFYNGILIVKDPTVERTADSITVTLPVTTMGGDLDRTFVVVLGKDGSDTLSQR